MTKDELLKELQELKGVDPEHAHLKADAVLLDYIDDKEIADAFKVLDKWYA